ncbi:MAG: maleylpyruvate isomerase N-terminal domain-containing protein, partial [Actinomycetota bacterium]
MTALPHHRFCQEVVTQTGLLRGVVVGADLSVTVPTTPDWTLGQLLRHVGGNLRSVETAVRTGTAVTKPERQVPDHGGPAGDDPAALDAWLAEAAAGFAETLAKAGPDARAQVW